MDKHKNKKKKRRDSRSEESRENESKNTSRKNNKDKGHVTDKVVPAGSVFDQVNIVKGVLLRESGRFKGGKTSFSTKNKVTRSEYLENSANESLQPRSFSNTGRLNSPKGPGTLNSQFQPPP